MALKLVILATVGGCGAQGKPATSPSKPVLVSAAASTSDAMKELAAEYKAKSGHEVRVNAGPSNALAKQILAGAPADVFLSANRLWAEQLDKPGLTDTSTALLTNKLVLVVPKGNPAGVSEPADLLKPSAQKIVLAGESVPAGMYAQQALTALELYEPLQKGNKIARGQDVRATLAYVERGEAEAGIVYSTDLPAAKGVETVDEFDPSLHDEIVYVLVLVRREPGNEIAKEFYEFLASSEAETVWRKFGFERCAAGSKDSVPPAAREQSPP